MVITQNHIINIQPGVSAPLVIHCSQGDTGSVINLTVVNGDETFDCSSYLCSVHGVRSDGANWGPYEVTVSGSTVSFPLKPVMTVIAGPCLAEITIGTVGTANFAILVENATFSLGVTYTEDVSLYQSILNYIMGAVQDIKTEATASVNKAIGQMNANTNAINAKYDAAIDQMNANTNAINAKYDAATTNFNQGIATAQNQYAVTNAKLDTAISAATQDSEVQDIRVKADGTSAATAGNAVREQITELKNDFNAERDYFDRQIIYGENRYYYDQSRLIHDEYITPSDGSFKPEEGWSITDFIPVDANSEYIMAYHSDGTYKQSNNNYYARYDKDFRFISTPASMPERATITTDANTKYVRISQATTRFSAMTIVVKKTIFDAGVSGKMPFSIKFIGDGEGVEVLKSDISELKSDVSELKIVPITYESQKRYSIINGALNIKTGKNYGLIKSAIISVNSRTVYYYTGRVYSYEDQYSLIAIDDNNNVLAYELDYTTDTQVNEYKFVIPPKATKLIVQSYKSNPVLKTEEVIDFEELIEKVNDVSKETNNDKVMRSICRMGEAYGQPESVTALKSCHNAGYNIIRVNLQFSSDGTAVLWHDQYINQHIKVVYDSSGALVPYSETDRIKISDTPLATLNQYKWGDASYATGIPTAEAIINAARKVGMELYFECKITLSEANINTIVSLVEKYGMRNRVSFAVASHANGEQIAAQGQGLRIGFMDSTFSEQLKTAYLSIKNLGAKMFWWGWDTMTLTNEIVEFLSKNGIDYECGDFTSYSAIDTYLSAEYAWYCTGMEIQGSMSPLIGQYIENNI